MQHDADTSQSLLERVKNQADGSSWRDFFDLYQPLLVRFARSRGLTKADADDVAQDCMVVLSKKMRSFDYARSKGKFRNFIFTLACNAITDMFRRRRPRAARTGEISSFEQSQDEWLSDWDRAWLREHLQYAMKRVEVQFSPQTMTAFQMQVIEENPVEEVCRRLDLTPDQVYKAKSRVTLRMRAELKRLVGDVL